MANEVQKEEVDWYRIRGKYPDRRIKTTSSGEPYVVGDWSWNQNPANPPEYFEKELYPKIVEGSKDRDERDRKIRLLKDGGMSLTDIGVRFGISRARVGQILERTKNN